MTTADDFFAGGTASAKFDNPGTTVAGPITRVGEPMQQRDFTTGAPKFWDDGKPMMQLPIDVQTSMRDPEIVNDDGVRTLYVRGEMQKAIRQAVRQVGAPGLRVGGQLSVTYTGNGTAKQRGMNPPKLYSATYTPPTSASGDEFLGAQGIPTGQAEPVAQQTSPALTTPAQAAATVAAQQEGDPALVAAISHLPVEQRNALIAAGVTADQVKAMGLAG